MVRYEIHSNPTGQYYLPKEVRQELGRTMSLICGVKAAVMFCPDEPIEVILESLDLLAQDLKHRMKIQQHQNNFREIDEASVLKTNGKNKNGSVPAASFAKPQFRDRKICRNHGFAIHFRHVFGELANG